MGFSMKLYRNINQWSVDYQVIGNNVKNWYRIKCAKWTHLKTITMSILFAANVHCTYTRAFTRKQAHITFLFSLSTARTTMCNFMFFFLSLPREMWMSQRNGSFSSQSYFPLPHHGSMIDEENPNTIFCVLRREHDVTQNAHFRWFSMLSFSLAPNTSYRARGKNCVLCLDLSIKMSCKYWR